MGDTTAAIVWGIPINPVDFLCSLDAFRKAITTIHTLRLCNQFGTGENAVITKLPKELIGYIEEELLAWHRQQERDRFSFWVRRHRCFEGSCHPSDHMYDVDPETYERMVEDAEITLHEAHPEWSTADRFGFLEFDFHADYQALLDAEMDKVFDNQGFDLVWEICFENNLQWTSDVRELMESRGNNDVLRKHFGLVDCNSLNLTEEHQQRFAWAIPRLDLKPSVHPSQLQKALSAASSLSISSSLRQVLFRPTNDSLSSEEMAKRDAVITIRVSGRS